MFVHNCKTERGGAIVNKLLALLALIASVSSAVEEWERERCLNRIQSRKNQQIEKESDDADIQFEKK